MDGDVKLGAVRLKGVVHRRKANLLCHRKGT
jgi:hypothetical protein